MIFWKKLPIAGAAILDGRWHCVLTNTHAKIKRVPAYCHLKNGVWLADNLEPLPIGWSVTHITYPPDVPEDD